MKTALITGSAKRLGLKIAKVLHKNKFNIIIHYLSSEKEAKNLIAKFNTKRENSAFGLQADLSNIAEITKLTNNIISSFSNLDLLINNASVFYPTSLDDIDIIDWQKIINTNLRAPFFLIKNLAPLLKKSQGSIINITDIYATKPLKNYPIYSISKAGLKMLTKNLALELAPDIRVNSIAPGAILWHKNINNVSDKKNLISKIPLNRKGSEKDIINAIMYLLTAKYVTGQTITIDGGRIINLT